LEEKMPWTVGSPPPVWSNSQILAQLGGGSYWSGSTITYSFPTTKMPLFVGQGEAVGFSALSAAQIAKAVIAFAEWDYLIAPSLVQTSANAGQIVLANSTTDDTGTVMGSNGYAYASSWTTGANLSNVQVWFNSWYNGSNGGAGNNLMNPAIGKHGFSTYIHEIGHALGLEHMGNYNGTINATTQASSYQDSTVFSIMSYLGPSWGSGIANGEGLVAWADWVGADGQLYDPQTAMLNDILALQNFYGADLTTRTDNTTYGFNSTLASVSGGIYDFTQNANPILCIYDAGGTDTLDLTGYSTASNLDLTSGSFSDCNSMTKNISIACSALIENGKTGGGQDTLTGNAVANILDGGAGDDTFNGGGGGDSFIGGSGNDTVTYAAEIVGLVIDMLTPGNGTGNAAGDTFNSIERIIGTDLVDNISGTNGDETLDGGNGNDILNGRGGNDAIAGGAGSDVAVYSGNFAQYFFNYNAGTLTYTVYNPDGSVDTVTGVETFQFADGSKTAAQLPITTGIPLRHVTITNLSSSLNEGNTGTTSFTFQVQLDGSGFSTQSVNYYVAGSGTNPTNSADFSGATSGILTFARGETVKTVTITVIGDTTYEQNETFALSLTAPTSGLIVDTVSTTSTIVNDDAAPLNIINGTAANDTLNGTSGADQINGLAGNDYLDGKAGADFLFGGDGDDQIVYDVNDLAANVNGGNGTDTLLINGGSLPTGFNLTASAFEKAVWTQTDTTNQAWSTILSTYDAAWRLTQSTTNYDVGTRSDYFYDVAGATNYQTLRNDFDVSNALTASYYLLDDNTRTEIFYDTANLNYQTVRNDYNTAGQRTATLYLLDNNSRSNIFYGQPGFQNTRADYDTLNRLAYTSYLATDGTLTQTYYDPADNFNYTSSRSDLNANGDQTFASTVYNNGTRTDVYYDVANQYSWNTATYNYDASLNLLGIIYA
jgi:serralysin